MVMLSFTYEKPGLACYEEATGGPPTLYKTQQTWHLNHYHSTNYIFYAPQKRGA